MNWQEIETAPKDGRHLQLYRPEIQFTGYYGGANSGWRINAPGLPAMWPLPTHWAPLPKSPKDIGSEESTVEHGRHQKLEAENARLREALKKIHSEAGSHTVTIGQTGGFSKIYDIARKALEGG